MNLLRLYVYILIFVLSAPELFSQGGLPQFDINKTYFNFGKTYLFQTKTDTMLIQNVGDTLLVFHSIDEIKPPFFSKIEVPDSLFENEGRNYKIIYRPYKEGSDSQRVYLKADTRLSNSIALLIDISNSMDYTMPRESSVKRINATNSAVRKFIDAMAITKKVWDEAAIYTFARNFYVNHDYSFNKTSLKNALTNSLQSSTYFYRACIETINRLKTRTFNKVMIALTDGEDNDPSRLYDADDVIAAALPNKIKVYTISIGSLTNDNNANLRKMATSTGGQYFEANTQKELEDIYYEIFNQLSKGISFYLDLIGYCPPINLAMECPTDVPKILAPGDTLMYSFSLKGTYAQGALDRNYKLKIKLNTSMLVPINEDYEYLDNGSILIKSTVSTNLDSNYLKTVKFLTLVGNQNCTDVIFDYIIWDDNYYADIKSGDSCMVCINLCARDLRQVMTLTDNELGQVKPNPLYDNSSIEVLINQAGVYNLSIYDQTGKLMNTFIDGYVNNGNYYFPISIDDYNSGYYYFMLRSENSIIGKSFIINK
jgi:hypothetical protein